MPRYFQAEISSFALYLAAEGMSTRTIRTYTEAAAWFAAAHQLERTSQTVWEQVGKRDVQEWMVWLLARYSPAYASNQYRGPAAVSSSSSRPRMRSPPMAGLHLPKVPVKLVPVFTGAEWAALDKPNRTICSCTCHITRLSHFCGEVVSSWFWGRRRG